jgi:hypothetical protein
MPIAGKAQAGKDTSAIIIKELLEKKGYRVCIVHYGDYLKYICKEYLGWNGEKDEAGRSFIQYEGTEYVRARDFDFWTNVVYNFVKIYKDRFDYFLIPDTRFPNEIDVFKNNNFDTFTLKIIRKNYKNSLTDEQNNHMSETALDDYKFDKVIEAESGVDNLKAEIMRWFDE